MKNIICISPAVPEYCLELNSPLGTFNKYNPSTAAQIHKNNSNFLNVLKSRYVRVPKKQ